MLIQNQGNLKTSSIFVLKELSVKYDFNKKCASFRVDTGVPGNNDEYFVS